MSFAALRWGSNDWLASIGYNLLGSLRTQGHRLDRNVTGMVEMRRSRLSPRRSATARPRLPAWSHAMSASGRRQILPLGPTLGAKLSFAVRERKVSFGKPMTWTTSTEWPLSCRSEHGIDPAALAATATLMNSKEQYGRSYPDEQIEGTDLVRHPPIVPGKSPWRQ